MNKTLTIRLDSFYKQKLVEELKTQLGEKSASKALLQAAKICIHQTHKEEIPEEVKEEITEVEKFDDKVISKFVYAYFHNESDYYKKCVIEAFNKYLEKQ